MSWLQDVGPASEPELGGTTVGGTGNGGTGNGGTGNGGTGNGGTGVGGTESGGAEPGETQLDRAVGLGGRLLVIIPALNEETALPGVIAELRAWSPHVGILVVDDGSTDGTVDVARAAGVAVAPLAFNLGVGGALQTGFRYAVRHGFTRAVQFDGDGQHDASEIPTLLAGLDDGADLVIGSRFARTGDGTSAGAYSVGRVRGGAMRGLQLTVRILVGHPFTDASSGFRAFSAPLLDFFARRYPNEFLGDTAEALLLAVRAGFAVVEVPVRMRPRAGGTPSNGGVKMAYHYVRVMVSMIGASPIRRTTVRNPVPDSGSR